MCLAKYLQRLPRDEPNHQFLKKNKSNLYQIKYEVSESIEYHQFAVHFNFYFQLPEN